MISEEMLRSAAAESRTIFVGHLERDFDPAHAHTFSPSFMRKIKKLTRRANHPVFYRGLQRVASVFLAMLIGASVWLSVDTQARAAFVQWVREVYEEHILYRYFNAPQDGGLPTYEITALPAGYTLTDSIVDETSSIHIFTNSNDVLIFTYYTIDKNTQTNLLFFDGYTHELASVGPYGADYYAANSSGECNELVWINNEDNLLFQISSFLAKTEILQIANSIVLSKK